MLKSFKFQLLPTKEQEVLLAKHFGCFCFVWNWALGEKMKAYQTDKTIDKDEHGMPTINGKKVVTFRYATKK
jgi:transposase